LAYRLLETFQATFQGRAYLHRRSGLGDQIAIQLYEDLYAVGKSTLYRRYVAQRARVLNIENRRRGVAARRGDATFGELIPGVIASEEAGYRVGRGLIATVEIGVEMKILAKAMIKQIDRVIGDLVKQVAHFKRGGGNPLCVGLVGINHALVCRGYEAERVYTTDGKRHKHPYQEAGEAEARLLAQAKPSFNEFLVLRYRASNIEPFDFEWVDRQATELDYGAILVRLSREYDLRFV
jgi:hypothetical protein